MRPIAGRHAHFGRRGDADAKSGLGLQVRVPIAIVEPADDPEVKNLDLPVDQSIVVLGKDHTLAGKELRLARPPHWSSYSADQARDCPARRPFSSEGSRRTGAPPIDAR